MERQITDVLIIDDDPDICILLKAILHPAGYTARNLLQAVRLPQVLESIQPRIILMDMHSAGKNGRAVCW